MDLKNVVPEMNDTFGVLEFAGEGAVEQRRVNGRPKILSRSYHLYSSKQMADDVVVILPEVVEEKKFSYEAKVKLINPRLIAEGKKIDNYNAYTNYTLLADDMVLAD